MKQIKSLLICLIVLNTHLFSQVYSDKIVGQKKADISDSIKKSEWPYLLPILGKKATKLGFKLPLPAGVNVNYLWQESDLVLENLEIGFNGGPKYNLDEIVRIDEAISTANIVNIRPDVWVLPFLNVYAIIAKSKPSTAVGFGIWVPDSANNWTEVTHVNTTAKFNATTFGFGFTPTIGVGGGWFALDMNFSWSDVDALEKPAFVSVFGPRFGKSFNFKNEQALAIWVGGFRVKFANATDGSLPLSDLFPDGGSGSDSKIDNAQQKVAEKQQSVDTWWNSLSNAQKQNPVNIAKHEAANRALTAASNILNAAEGAVDNIGNSTVQYSLDKRVKDPWNMIVGGQYQLNRHWMLRGEFGFLGSRQQILFGLQYRFGF